MKALRINIPVNVCVSIPAGALAGDGDLCAEAAELVHDRIEGQLEDALKGWFKPEQDVRLYAIPAADVIDNDRASVETRDDDDAVDPEARVNVPANVCISLPMAEGESEGDLIGRAAQYVHQGLSGDVANALRSGFDPEHDVRLYARDPELAVVDSSIEDVEEVEEERFSTKSNEQVRPVTAAEYRDALRGTIAAFRECVGAETFKEFEARNPQVAIASALLGRGATQQSPSVEPVGFPERREVRVTDGKDGAELERFKADAFAPQSDGTAFFRNGRMIYVVPPTETIDSATIAAMGASSTRQEQPVARKGGRR